MTRGSKSQTIQKESNLSRAKKLFKGKKKESILSENSLLDGDI